MKRVTPLQVRILSGAPLHIIKMKGLHHMQLKRRPKKPIFNPRYLSKYCYEMGPGEQISYTDFVKAIELFAKENDISEVSGIMIILPNNSDDYGLDYLTLKYEENTDPSYAEKLKQYHSDLTDYNNWKKENAKEIAEHENEVKKKREERARQARITELEAELSRLRKDN